LLGGNRRLEQRGRRQQRNHHKLLHAPPTVEPIMLTASAPCERDRNPVATWTGITLHSCRGTQRPQRAQRTHRLRTGDAEREKPRDPQKPEFGTRTCRRATDGWRASRRQRRKKPAESQTFRIQ